ncbi:MAG TPA: methyltransferase [Candidatus Saccharimonas sp.]|nr:methyltransferase [Candidatus Saccharimonas sp.]
MTHTDTDRLRQDLSFQATLHGQPLSFHTTWGLFSPKAIDEGTQLLADLFDVAPTADCLDLGCGYGPLGLTLAKLSPRGTVHLIDKDFVAVQYAATNAQLNDLTNTTAYLSNGFDQVPPEARFDVIASNIPAKIGGEQLSLFLADAHARLKPGGQLYIVTISGLKDYMKRHLTDQFGNYDKLRQSRTYTAALAIRR